MQDKFTFDFHVHTYYSDADMDQSPEAVSAAAAQADLDAIAITDHDHIISREECRVLSQQHGILVVPGCELSTALRTNDGLRPAHLGLHWPGEWNAGLRQMLKHNNAQPFDEYTMRMVHNFIKLGLDPTHGRGESHAYEQLCALHPHSNHHGKRDVVDYMVRSGALPDREIAYQMLAYGGPAYVDPMEVLDFVPFEEAVQTAAQCSVCTWNHPGYSHLEDEEFQRVLLYFAKYGDAIEVIYPNHDHQRQQELFGYCRAHGLLPNCGSDRHDRSRDFLQGPGHLYDQLYRRKLKRFGE